MGFQGGDAGGVEGVGAEEFGGAVGFGGGGGEVLPEFDAFAGVVTGAGHVEGAEFVGFEFLAAGEAEHGRVRGRRPRRVGHRCGRL